MDHLLSQIKFQAKLKAQYTGATKITVTGFKLSFATNKIKNAGTYTFNTNNTDNIWVLDNTYHNVAIEKTNLANELDNTVALDVYKRQIQGYDSRPDEKRLHPQA